MDAAGGDIHGVGHTATAAILAGFSSEVIPFTEGGRVSITWDGGYGCEGTDVVGKGGGAEEVDFIVIAHTIAVAIDEVGGGVVFPLVSVVDAIAIEVTVCTIGGVRGFSGIRDAESVGNFPVIGKVVIVLVVGFARVGGKVR